MLQVKTVLYFPLTNLYEEPNVFAGHYICVGFEFKCKGYEATLR